MDFAGSIAMPLSIFAFVMTMYVLKQVGVLQTKVADLEKQLSQLPQRSSANT